MAPALPKAVAALAAELTRLPGVLAVVLGGSRAHRTHGPDSDWDLGLYYRASQRPIDPDGIRRLGHGGHVSEIGAWGPIVNGGAWLTIGDTPVDVLFRDLDVIDHWRDEAEHGRFEVLTQNGYLAGAPTYLPVGELALCVPIAGELPRPLFPDALAIAAPDRWRGRAGVSLMFAASHASSGDTVCCSGMLAHAVVCEAHARLARRREWVLNEKRLVERADLGGVQRLLARPGATGTALQATVAAVSAALALEVSTPR